MRLTQADLPTYCHLATADWPHSLSGIEASEIGGNHATHHLLCAVDRYLDMLDGQRNLGSELRRLQMDADCRWMHCILYLKRCSGRRIF